MVPLCPSWGQGSPTSWPGGTDPWLPELSGGGAGPEGKQETELGTLRQLRGGRTGRQTGDGVFGAWQMQRLIAELTPAAALETQAGTMRQAWATPSPPSLGSPRFQSFRQGSHGQLRASLGLPGHLRGVGPANGTRPVGLGGDKHLHIRPHSHLPPVPSGSAPQPGGDAARSPALLPQDTRTPGVARAALPSTTCQHTWRGTHGRRGGLGAAAAPQSR